MQKHKALGTVLAVALIVVGLVIGLIGVGTATVWRPDPILAPTAVAGDSIRVTDPGVLSAGNDAVLVTATAEPTDQVVLALGRETDVLGWLGDARHEQVTGLTDEQHLTTETTGTDTTELPDPSTSDMWLMEVDGAGRAELSWTSTDDNVVLLSAVVDTDGKVVGSPALTLSWSVPVSQPWLVPAVAVGVVMIAAGIALLVRSRRKTEDDSAAETAAVEGSVAPESPEELPTAAAVAAAEYDAMVAAPYALTALDAPVVVAGTDSTPSDDENRTADGDDHRATAQLAYAPATDEVAPPRDETPEEPDNDHGTADGASLQAAAVPQPDVEPVPDEVPVPDALAAPSPDPERPESAEPQDALVVEAESAPVAQVGDESSRDDASSDLTSVPEPDAAEANAEPGNAPEPDAADQVSDHTAGIEPVGAEPTTTEPHAAEPPADHTTGTEPVDAEPASAEPHAAEPPADHLAASGTATETEPPTVSIAIPTVDADGQPLTRRRLRELRALGQLPEGYENWGKQ